MLERLRNRNQEVSVLKLEVAPEVIPGSGTGSHYWKLYRKSFPEVVPEVMTGRGTGSHTRKGYPKS